MWVKRSEDRALRTTKEYEIHFQRMIKYFGEDLSAKDVNTEMLLEWVTHMRAKKSKGGQEHADNMIKIRARTIRAFVRWCLGKGHISIPIHEDFKPKSKQDKHQLKY
jgi:integrase/recombinase XerD